MKVECSKQDLIDKISLVEKVVGKNSSLPILSCLHFEARGNTFTVRATNLDIGVEVDITAKVVEEGIVVVPGNILHASIAHLYTTNAVTLALSSENLLVTAPGSTTTIKALPSDDFPTLPQVDQKESFSIATQELLRGLRAVWYSASTSTIKPELASVYLYHLDGKLYFVATDSFRLAEKVLLSKGTYTFDPILIPARNVPELIRILESIGDDSAVEVRLTQNQIAFTATGLYATSRLVDGTFPDYKQIMPKEYVTEVVMLRQDLIGALRHTTVFSDKFNQVSFSINPAQKKLILSASNADVGETQEQLDAALSGEELDIHFNHRYLHDGLATVAADSVSLQFSGKGKPMVMKGVSDNSFIYLVMPMNR